MRVHERGRGEEGRGEEGRGEEGRQEQEEVDANGMGMGLRQVGQVMEVAFCELCCVCVCAITVIHVSEEALA